MHANVQLHCLGLGLELQRRGRRRDDHLNRFPSDVPPGDLLASFTLSDADLDLIGDRRGDHNRLGYALQLKALPYLGFVPDDLATAPSRFVAYLALQLSVPCAALTEYGDREHTRTDHLREIQDRLVP